MSSRKWVSFVACLTPMLFLLSACSDEEGKIGNGGWTNVCIDDDGDGYGLQCSSGSDCDDQDPLVHQGCAACSKPSEGCNCTPGAAPIACTDLPEVTGDGDLLCKEGTRYCRDGIWTACEGIRSYTAPPPNRVSGIRQALIGDDAAVQCTGACNRDCWMVQDPIEAPTGDAGGLYNIDSGFAYTDSGGITVTGRGPDATTNNPDELDPVPPCATATDMDCDNIPDSLDPYPGEPPFESENETLFFDIPAGASVSHTYDLRFYLRTADIYFLLDMTGSMDQEKANLINSLKTGNFLNDPSTAADESATIECADRDFNGSADNDLKNLGVAGNIACLIRSAGFGAGWFREVPFSNDDNYSINYSYPNFEAYEHRMDISAEPTAVDALSTALGLFVTRGNQNWAESGGVALSAVTSGGPIYMGWDRPGIPARTCTTGWGWPCFRDDAMPIVVLITDAPIMNGPAPTSQIHLGDESRSTWKPNGTSTGKQPVNYDSTGLGYMSATPDQTYHPVSGNESTTNNPHDVGVIDSVFKTFTGNTRGMAADLHSGNVPYCSQWPTTSAGAPGYPDAVFKFKVNDATKPLTISTRGSRFKPTLSIYPTTTAATAVTATTNATAATAHDLGVLNAVAGVNISGNTDPVAFNTGEMTADMVSECLRTTGTAPSATAPDAWFKFTVPADIQGVTFSADGSDFDAVLGLWEGVPPAAGPTGYSLGTNDKFFTSAAALPTGTATTPGAINGRSVWLYNGNTDVTAMNADYSPNLFDVDSTCSGVSNFSKDSVIDFIVTGTAAKKVRIETTSSSTIFGASSFDNVIGLFARPATSGGTLGDALYCNRAGAGTNRGFLEETLNPGTYSVIVRGEKSSDRGTYGALISDSSVRTVACHNEATTKNFTTSLRAGVTYYLGMRGRLTSQGSGRGPYTIKIGGALCAYDNAVYSQKTNAMGVVTDPEYALGAAEIVDQRFPVGEYYAVVKGRGNIAAATGDDGRGMYQITFGDRTLATNNLSAEMPQWGNSTSGIQKQLTDRGVRVLTVSSVKTCSGCTGGATNANTALKEQADIISRNTGAIGESDTTRSFDIFNDGSGMGRAVVTAIATLTGNVAMDVTLRLKAYDPDIPVRPFQFKARAIDVSGDSCAPPVDTNSDGVLDTHKGCAPGATPRFEFTITNPPAPNNVPINPRPMSNGGYAMKIEMIGDGKYIVDSSPVFIIPEDVVPDPASYTYDASGSYAQDISASCTGTDRPNWQALGWSDTLPESTSMVWRVCAGDSTTDLNTCQANNAWVTVATVSAGIACTSSTQCTDGYCSGGICHHPVSPTGACASSADCGTGGVCSGTVCKWSSNPISLLPALKNRQNGKAMVRAQVELNANMARTAAPTVTDFSLRYVCSPGL